MLTADSQPHQTLLCLVGLPGSGKSTLAEQFRQRGWQVICQDVLGNRKACEAACSQALAAGRSVVIDRCNFDMVQRAHWIQLARLQQQHGGGRIVHLLALCLQLPVEECVARAGQRGDHPTLAPGEAAAVVSRMWGQWQRPTTLEGFHSVLLARSCGEAGELAARLLAQHPVAAEEEVEPAVPQPVAAAAGGAGQRQRSPAAAAAYLPPHQRQRLQQAQAMHTSAGAGGSGNIVPFPGRQGGSAQEQEQGQGQGQGQGHLPRRHPWTTYDHDVLSTRVLDAGLDPQRPVLLFDANGVLTSHTSVRRSTGLHEARPGLHHLRRLLPHYHIGLFSSASLKTVNVAVPLIEAAAGPGSQLFDRRLILNRTDTFLAPAAHVAAGGKGHDTVKPLAPYFSRLHRVLLVDDDAHKSVAGEERNMVLMPSWREGDKEDAMVARLVDVLVALAESVRADTTGDIRNWTAQATAQLQERVPVAA